MALEKESIKGAPIPSQPASIARCGLSQAQFARRQGSGEWYELSSQGRRIGAPIEFDFYREVEGNEPVARSDEKELAAV